MIAALILAIRERLKSGNWWAFVLLAAASFALYRSGALVLADKALTAAQERYRAFYAKRQVRFFDRIAKWAGAQKFMAVLNIRNPDTGLVDSKTVWFKADSAVQAMRRIQSVDWGKGFKVVTLSQSGQAVESAAKAVRKTWTDFMDMAKDHPQSKAASPAPVEDTPAEVRKPHTRVTSVRPKKSTLSQRMEGSVDSDAPTMQLSPLKAILAGPPIPKEKKSVFVSVEDMVRSEERETRVGRYEIAYSLDGAEYHGVVEMPETLATLRGDFTWQDLGIELLRRYHSGKVRGSPLPSMVRPVAADTPLLAPMRVKTSPSTEDDGGAWVPQSKVWQTTAEEVDVERTNLERRKRGLPVPWSPRFAGAELLEPPVP